jgi:cysteine synthase
MVELINKVVDHHIRDNAVCRFREKSILLPTFAQLRDPQTIPQSIRDSLRSVGLWDVNPLNLFRITWKNEPVETGGGFGPVNCIELPPVLTGIPARIIVLIGKWFPTGAHKVGAAYGCLVPRIITGQFDPEYHKAVWPSTGNYCRGGAFDSCLMGCTAVAVLPEEMSRERFEWLQKIGADIITTPGCESNVKEIFDRCRELRQVHDNYIIFNQFEEFGNACWHYHVTGPAVHEAWNSLATPTSSFAAFVSATGSAGTIAAGDYLRKQFPGITIVAAEALQCPTLLMNGFGAHRIEGIGDKHVPWIHNVRNTDIVTAIDDSACMRLLRLFNESAGQTYLVSSGIDNSMVSCLSDFGISSIANILSAIKTARYLELSSDDILFTVATDSAGLYQSRLQEMNERDGAYTERNAIVDFGACLASVTTDHMKELTYTDRKAIHNLKYYTWVEQQDKPVEDLNQLWYDRTIWQKIFAQPEQWDPLIQEFNNMTGLGGNG